MPSEKNTAFAAASLRPLWLAAALLLASCALFLTLNAGGNWDFVLPLRLTKLAALLMVAYAVGVSTVLFQTLTNNPILTPSILGFDALYVFLQTLLVFLLGSIGYAAMPVFGKFGLELAAMMGGSLLLFAVLMKQGGRDLARMILIGVIFGILFRSLASLLQRMIDPEEFAVAQANTFASFNTLNQDLLGIGTLILLASVFFIWRERHRLDVYLLGRDQAINLGIDYTRNTLWILLWIAVLVATSTAIVGPVSFFGLLVAALANHFSPSVKHAVRLPMVFCTAAVLLVGGQALFEHVLGMKAVLSVVVEFAGGLVFLWLVLKRKQ
ncbi:iron chelate uptake ABC transporter family permease subunit [Neisseria chenwenguii]|uniref:Iron ABC transporter permease n=1 Tax=Neisseria chenwenguii TaxID=1853278 RepID=A0A220S0F6_9NEIS|nr:iron chelate uptake ABC transporter family permease subunit [Neisseria chenwenguii]ASK26903.1 iron ABC transporter permease [Neisseria chenwenguii]ROV56699.1 iron ABC transporter permease [Neisseria chenwenguii]